MRREKSFLEAKDALDPDRRARWAINGRFLTQRVTGVQRYAIEITRAIDARLVADEALARRMQWEIILPADCETPSPYQAISIRHSRYARGYLWEQMVLPLKARGGLVNFANLAPLAHPRQIACLHDANVFLEPGSYARSFSALYRTLYPIVAQRARQVVTVSQFSLSMLDRFGVLNQTGAVIGNGHEHALRWNAKASRFNAPDAFRRPFVFALGSIAKHKQIDRLVALAPALDALGIDLLVSGSTASIYAQTALPQSSNVVALGFVSDDDLAALFQNALCFAFPSRTEGFGIPLLEAMVHGCPIITENQASMPEVCADAALFASVTDETQWLAALKALRDSPALRNALRDRGRQRYPRFSWQDGGDAYLKLALALSPKMIDTRLMATTPYQPRTAFGSRIRETLLP